MSKWNLSVGKWIELLALVAFYNPARHSVGITRGTETIASPVKSLDSKK